MNIVFYSPGKDSQSWLGCLQTHFPQADVWTWTPDSAGRQADYAVLWSPPAELFASQHHLKAIFNIGAGVDRVLGLPDVMQLTKGVPIVRLNDAGMAVQMAEYVCHALFRCTRNFRAYDAQQLSGDWKVLPPIKRADWPVGVMGLGDIGARVAQAVAAFDYPTYGWSRTPKSLPGITTFAGAENIATFLREVRVLVCVLPLTAETSGILNRENLSKLRGQGYLINVARGTHLVEEDLLALLDGEVLIGATLDVFKDEPLPSNHVFWTHPKISITPHISATTLREESAAQIAEKIRALEGGKAIDGVVEAARGY